MALSQQSAALTALVSHLIQGGDSFGLEASGSTGASSSSTRGTLKREQLQQSLATGQSRFFMMLQQQICRRLQPSNVVPRTEEELNTPGEVWWFQGAKRSRPCYVGHCACSRCSLSGRSSHDSRVLGLGSYGIGAKCVRCGKLGFGLHSHASRSSTSSSLSGEDDFSDSLSQTFLPPDSSQHGHHRIGLSQGDRCPPKQTAGDPAKEGPAIKAGGRYIAKPEETAKVPEEAEGPGRRPLERPQRKQFKERDNATFLGVRLSPRRDRPETCPTRNEQGDVSNRPSISPLLEAGLLKGNLSASQSEAGSSGLQFLQTRRASYPLWISRLTSLVLKTRCSFSAFLAFSIRISSRSSPRTTRTPPLFPVPIPLGECSAGCPQALQVLRGGQRCWGGPCVFVAWL